MEKKLLFVLKSTSKSEGGSVFAPMMVRDLLVKNENFNIDILSFKVKNIFEFLFNINFSKPNYTNSNNKSCTIEFISISQYIIWLISNLNKYNLVVLHGIWSFIYLISSLFSLIFRVPYCFHPHGSLDPFDINKKKRILKNFLGYSIYKLIFKFSMGFIFTTTLEASRAQSFDTKIKKYIATLTSPNETKIKKYNSEYLNKVKANYDLEKNEKILLFLSRIDPKKGLDILLKAFYLFNKRNKRNISASLLVAGNGNKEYLKYINNIKDELNLNSKIKFLGRVDGDKKIDLMQISDLFVLPTLNENFGISVVEALQNNLTVLITKNVYIHETIIKNKAGYICNRNIEDLALKIDKILFEDQNQLIVRSYNCYKANFSREKCSKDHSEIYIKMINIK